MHAKQKFDIKLNQLNNNKLKRNFYQKLLKNLKKFYLMVKHVFIFIYQNVNKITKTS